MALRTLRRWKRAAQDHRRLREHALRLRLVKKLQPVFSREPIVCKDQVVSPATEAFQRFVGRCHRCDIVAFGSQRNRQHQPYVRIVFEQQDAHRPEGAGVAAFDARRRLRAGGAHISNYDSPTSAG